MEFTLNGKTIFLKKNINESKDIFIEKGNIIIKNINKFKNINDLKKLINIYINNKYYKCIYDKELLKNINCLEFYN
tara:strand:- start:700 stop:927 length:228 start_codon:yes stop_codon:yes gene_type:complete